MKDVFISHATEDQATAAEVCALLEARGIQCWIAPRDVAPGKVWDEAILDAIESTSAFLLILSKSANESHFVKNEVNRAFSQKKPIITFRTEEVTPGRSLELYLARHHWTDGFPQPLEPKVDQLTLSIATLVGKAAVAGVGSFGATIEDGSAAGSLPLARTKARVSRLANLRMALARRWCRDPFAWSVAAAALVVTAMTIPTMWHLREAALLPQSPASSASQSTSIRFLVLPPEKGRFDSGAGSAAAYNSGGISPDGRKLAFTVRDTSGRVLLWVRALDSIDAQALPGTDRASLPFWSPDSRSIGFFADGKLKRVDANGGPVQTVTDLASPRGGAWGRQDVILFSRYGQGPLYRVLATGGEPTPATVLTPQQRSHRVPTFFPDGERFTYFANGAGDSNGVFITNLKSGETRRLAASDSVALYSAGYVLLVEQGGLMAQPFSLTTLQFTGQATRIAESVASIQGVPGFSVSANGTLIYRKGSNAQKLQLAWFDRRGKLIRTIGQAGGYMSPSLAPDGKRIAVHRHDGAGGDIWVAADGETFSRFTFDASQDNSVPIWSPDGRSIAFGSLRHGRWGVYEKLSNGTGNEQLLIELDAPSMPMSWSPDGKYLVYYMLEPKTSTDLWALPLRGDRKPFPIAQTVFSENHGQISPDGKWIAFNSDESGGSQIYVKPFPAGQGKWQASTTGGIFARWRRDGKELFYMESNDGGRMMSVDVKATGSAIEFSQPHALFDSGYYNMNHPTNWLAYDVSPDGQRFLITRPEGTVANSLEETPITVITNWTAVLKK
jgi:eukaryotic-like serine/threonine-protein kinase